MRHLASWGRVACLIVLFVATMADANQPRLKFAANCGLYVSRGEWKKPPVESGLVGYQWVTPASIISLSQDGTFEMIVCWLRRTRRETSISQGDGQTIWFGKVEETEEKLLVQYKMVKDIAGVVLNSPEQKAYLFLGKGFLVFNGDIYDVTDTVKQADFLSYINDCRAEAKSR